MSTDKTTAILRNQQRVAQIKADHKMLVEQGQLPANCDALDWAMACGCDTLQEIEADAKRQSVSPEAYVQTYLDEITTGVPMVAPTPDKPQSV